MNTTRLRELCDAVENGSARQEDVQELARLARDMLARIEHAGELLGLAAHVQPKTRKQYDPCNDDALMKRIEDAVRNKPNSSFSELYDVVGGNKHRFATMLRDLNECGVLYQRKTGRRHEYYPAP